MVILYIHTHDTNTPEIYYNYNIILHTIINMVAKRSNYITIHLFIKTVLGELQVTISCSVSVLIHIHVNSIVRYFIDVTIWE